MGDGRPITGILKKRNKKTCFPLERDPRQNKRAPRVPGAPERSGAEGAPTGKRGLWRALTTRTRRRSLGLSVSVARQMSERERSAWGT